MNAPTLIAILALAGIIHATFQLSVSMLTLVGGHALGAKTRHNRIVNLMASFSLGAMSMTMLLLASFAYASYTLLGTYVTPLAWALVCGLMAGVAVAVWIFYYRHKSGGTTLWIPRPLARMLHDRIKATKSDAESFSLGLTSVIAEILFIIAPVTAGAFALVQLPHYLQVAGVILYTLLASLPLVIVTVLVGSGRSIDTIQRWREQNKRFIQFIAGSALFVLAFYIYVNAALAPMLLLRSV